ncbi:MAG: 2-oxoglutarate dehydrogenase component, partial [Abditibacteriota bacterium]|nr:2-oxoglutarate dehydrogenase component [Abditibacteriota bacterium]
NGHSNGTAHGSTSGHSSGHIQIGPSFKPSSLFNPAGATTQSALDSPKRDYSPTNAAQVQEQVEERALIRAEAKALQERVNRLVHAHRVRGHLIAHLDPLDLPRPYPEELDPEFYGFTSEHMGRLFSYEIQHYNIYQPENTGLTRQLTLHEIIDHLRSTYCRYIGAQFTHIDDLEVREWLQERMETTQNRLELSRKDQLRILTRLTDAVIFEEFIRRKFVGAKSFSLEGAESVIPLLDLAIEEAGEQGIDEIVMGMAHRGRLNVLANIIGKSPRQIFREFEDKDADLHIGGGDVKYHLGHVNDWQTSSGKKVHLSLCFNPSHLEFVNPVALGRVRAKQDRMGDRARDRGMVILIHGDAAFAGEGVVQESLNLSQLPAYHTGGTLHIVINNQIGFTTGPEQGRSTTYATDVAKMLQIPIFHVNGEDPEAVSQTVKLSMEFRKQFKRDVVIDMYCYRKLGHNEADEPAFTQPRLYRAIAARKPVREAYLERLLEMNGITREEADQISDRARNRLEKELDEARSEDYHPPDHMRQTWGGYFGGPESNANDCDTSLPQEKLSELLLKQTKTPGGFEPHPKIKRFLQTRERMANGVQPLDWSAAEAVAFASLAEEGVPIRLTGQDVERGTFSHRHSVLHDVETDETYMPLQHLCEGQARAEILNSPLSEIGVLGFEYGYSLDSLGGLTLWEAQFGDFWNCAQVIVDQFISSAEDKWHHLSGLVMLLPHGFEGMGPEHSSARLERFLALCAEDNIQVAYPTTPAQYFHLLRRQALRRWRKPLIVMSPKSLLRHLECVSTLDEMANGKFQKVIGDALERPASEVTKVLLCSGKIYYELDKQRESLGRNDVAIIRMEQLYPFPEDDLREVLQPYADGTQVLWVQEEPMNMGAWRFMRVWLGREIFGRLPFRGVYRAASASPATGSASSHRKEQEKILEEAFGGQEADPSVMVRNGVISDG